MNIIEVNDTKYLDEFYNDWDLTFVGTTIDDENLLFLKNWFEEYNCKMLKEDFYVINGKLMNDYYNLTGNNQYPNNLNILVVKQKDLENVNNIVMPRFELGGRWFTDIVDNNEMREREEAL